MENIAREIAFMLDEDNITNEELQGVLSNLEDRIKSGEDNETMLANYRTLKDAERELDSWGEAHAGKSQAMTGRPVPVSVFFVIDDARTGVAREQRIEVITSTALSAIRFDLRAGGFLHVANVPDAGTTTGSSEIWFKPDPEDYIAAKDHARGINAILKTLVGDKDYREESQK